MANDRYFLGLDFSTQQIKVVVTDDSLSVVYENAVKFDSELPEYGTKGGAHIQDDNMTVTAPTIMWVKALDLLLDRMKKDNFDFSKVAALSGAGQQHGSVYWQQGACSVLKNLQPDRSMHEQLQSCFSVADSPIWMDSSTTDFCRQLENAVGGPQALAELTGSCSYERFTGHQIAKIYKTQPNKYADTERIALVSSFSASLFLGDYAAIDDSDGSGMNLMDIHKRDWAAGCLDACGPALAEKLGGIVPSATALGHVSSYLCERYGFSKDCEVIAFTGDNPASVAGMRLQKGDVIVSLGTSDTVLLWLDEARPSEKGGHILANPLHSPAYIAMLCYKNGSLVREKIRDENAGELWEKFNEMLSSSSQGNQGCIGMYYDLPEIIPRLTGRHRFCGHDKPQTMFHSDTEVRAIIEGQFIAKRVHAEMLGYTIGPETRVLATGGASSNLEILQVLSDVFNANVYISDVPNSASLGGAYRAKHASCHGNGQSFRQVTQHCAGMKLVAQPNADAQQTYAPMVARFKMLEQSLLEKQ